MNIKILVLTVMLGILGRAYAAGGFYSASDILSDCESESVEKQNYCLMYLAGIADTTNAWVAWGDLSRRYCVPSGVDTGQLRKIYTQYANKRSDRLDDSASSMALDAFIEKFPCE